MLKKIILSVLLITVIGVGGAALAYNAITKAPEPITANPEPLGNRQGYNVEQQGVQPVQIAQVEPVLLTQGADGDPWEEIGTITEIDDFGFQFALQNGEVVYIELGPPYYWQNQDFEIQVGQLALVKGTITDDMIHASQVKLADGQTLQVRNDFGQPLWSGGVTNGQGQNSGQADGDRIPEPQAQVDEWITIEGTLMSFQGGSMTMSTLEGELLTFQTGQPRFFADQCVTFQVGDEIIVVGFYEGEQFTVGEITQVTTGLRVMLRDPNGRPLWAGPGNGNGNGNGGNQGGKGSAGRNS